MAIIKNIGKGTRSVGGTINYIANPKKTTPSLCTGIYCSDKSKSAIREMLLVQELYRKKGKGRQGLHLVISYSPKDDITSEYAHEYSVDFISKEKCFNNHQMYIATHTDKEYIHTHIVVNSVNIETGKKVQLNGYTDYKDMKLRLIDMCREKELEVEELPSKSKKRKQDMSKHYENKTINKAIDGQSSSWKLEIYKLIMKVRTIATSKDSFISLLAKRGIRVTWKDSRKNITFENKDGKKVRSSNLEKTFKINLRKEELTDEFRRNKNRRAKQTDRGRRQRGDIIAYEGARESEAISLYRLRELSSKDSTSRVTEEDGEHSRRYVGERKGSDNGYRPEERTTGITATDDSRASVEHRELKQRGKRHSKERDDDFER